MPQTRSTVRSGGRRFGLRGCVAAVATVALVVAGAVPANAGSAPNGTASGGGSGADRTHRGQPLAPRTFFTMNPDGSSGLTAGGEGIPNIDSDKKTIYAYYGDPGTGIANKASSPYITEMSALVRRLTAELRPEVPAGGPAPRKAGVGARHRRHDALDV